MASYERSLAGDSMYNNRGFFSKVLRNLSTWGMDADQMVVANTISTGRHDDITNTSNANTYDSFSRKVISKFLDRKALAILDRAYPDKRKILRQYSIKDEIKDFINDMADEIIIYDDETMFCKAKDLPMEFDEEVRRKYQDNFMKLMRKFGFTDGLTAWNYIKNFLIDGYIAFEIVYDNKQKNIIDLSPIDPMTLIMATDPETGTIIWLQHPEDPANRRVLLDSQIVYISYSNNSDFCETSYVENLIRPYNQMKLIEQTKILFNINHASIYRKFIVPVNGLTKKDAEQQVEKLMYDYYEDVQWDQSTGEVMMNGSKNIPFSKDVWLPSGEAGQPSFELVPPGGIDLNEDTMLRWFSKILKKASKFPMSRFDEEGGGGNLHNDIAEITRDEIKFGKYIDRMRVLVKEMIIKPLRIQMILDYPELKDDNLFNTSLNVVFNSNQLFEEWKMLNNLTKRSEIVSTLNSNLQDSEGKPYFCIEFLLKKYMKFSDEDLAENDRMKMLGSSAGAQGQGVQGGAQGGGAQAQFSQPPAQQELGGGEPQTETGSSSQTPEPGTEENEF